MPFAAFVVVVSLTLDILVPDKTSIKTINSLVSDSSWIKMESIHMRILEQFFFS